MLLSGPPGTGKTLFARTLAKESGLPFVFASGAEFTDSEKSGAAKINEMFSVARRNVSPHLLYTHTIIVDLILYIISRHLHLCLWMKLMLLLVDMLGKIQGDEQRLKL